MDNIKKAIKIFNSVRDIKYHCPTNTKDKDHRCWGKNRILYSRLKKQGFKVRYRVCNFKWSKQMFPKKVTSLAPRNIDYHLFLEINLNNNWIILDAAIDSGLPRHNKWKGKSDCKISVIYEKIFSPQKSKELEKQEKPEFKKIYSKAQKLCCAINNFLDKKR